MPNSYIRLQGLQSASSSAAQSVENAIEVGAFDRVMVQVQRASAASEGSFLVLQTAATQDASRFVDLSPAIDLGDTGEVVEAFDRVMRYLRWRVSIAGGTAQFIVDVVGQEL